MLKSNYQNYRINVFNEIDPETGGLDILITNKNYSAKNHPRHHYSFVNM